ncbi:MAG: hypothetical protein R3B41_01640 [Candidatus Doudnabacteria bacterium]
MESPVPNATADHSVKKPKAKTAEAKASKSQSNRGSGCGLLWALESKLKLALIIFEKYIQLHKDQEAQAYNAPNVVIHLEFEVSVALINRHIVVIFDLDDRSNIGLIKAKLLASLVTHPLAVCSNGQALESPPSLTNLQQ